ncbi:MAG: TonB-dependent receptor [Chitinophagaceae bacterium]|nr:TonB-dependent receptor [Chitinophagaceae bacterium]
MQKLLLIVVLSLSFFHLAEAQSHVRGVVKNGGGARVPGATVNIKGTTIYTAADSLGEFSIEAPKAAPFTLHVTAAGFHGLSTKYDNIPAEPVSIVLVPNELLDYIVVTSRRRSEVVQNIPIPISVVGGNRIADAGAFNVSRLKELVPTVQLYSSNARNTTLNIRGLGSTYGLTNDGIDPGVGFYLDGVYLARPAATVLDFIDVERIEVLRGPQGTLFGKNTTAGAFNITSRAAEFKPGAVFEASYGNFGYIQAKASITGPLIANKLAARVSFSGTQRDGNLYNVSSDRKINDLNNLGVRGQLLYTPSDNVKISLAGDVTSQKPDGYGWAVAGVVKTQRSDYRQFNTIIADLGYTLPYKSAFERKVDLDTRSKADNELGGVSLNADIKIGNGTLTSTTAWRYWKWIPLNDRDYLGIPVFTVSAGNSVHDQWSQEFRYSGKIGKKITGVVGLYGLWQDLKTDPVHTEEAGSALWRFYQNNASATAWETPGLLDNFGIKTVYGIKSTSLAAFTQIDWSVTPQLHILPGLRYNYDKKVANYNRVTYGGLETDDEALLALKKQVYSDQSFNVNADAGNVSGQLSVQYIVNNNYNAFATFSKSYKPIGVNVGGLPTASGKVMTELATVKPESVQHFEVGIKTTPLPNTILNLTVYQNNIKDYQTLVQTPEPGVNRGYLANAEKARTQGFELDGSFRPSDFISINAALAYTDGKYVKFTNAPVPLEEVGGAEAFKDISGGALPGISKWSWTVGTELSSQGKFLGWQGHYFLGADLFYRSEFSSSPSPSQYLNIDAYYLLNARLGFRANNGFTLFAWSRNLGNKDYYEQLLAAPGNYGQYAGVVGDARTFGVTVRYALKLQP